MLLPGMTDPDLETLFTQAAREKIDTGWHNAARYAFVFIFAGGACALVELYLPAARVEWARLLSIACGGLLAWVITESLFRRRMRRELERLLREDDRCTRCGYKIIDRNRPRCPECGANVDLLPESESEEDDDAPDSAAPDGSDPGAVAD